MNKDLPFDTIFTAYPLLNISVLVGVISYIGFAVMVYFFHRSQLLKEVLDGKYDIEQMGLQTWTKEPVSQFIKWDRKRCFIQSVISAVFLVAVIGIFIYYLMELGTSKDVYMFVFTFSLLISCQNLIKSVINKTGGFYSYLSIIFDIACIVGFGWILYLLTV
ncbi:hypothetical protein RNP36_25290 (plasmid) [Escherichia coli]|nr:hypothetical protein RNP36_25290 [Escherichia coli]